MPPKKSVKTTSKVDETQNGEHVVLNVVSSSNSLDISNEIDTSNENDLVTPDQFQKGNVNKKRGRKPKGGKIMTNLASSVSDISEIPNIILHLKCHMSDLKSNDTMASYEYSPSIEDIQSYTPASNIINCSDIISTFNNNDHDDNSLLHDNNNDNIGSNVSTVTIQTTSINENNRNDGNREYNTVVHNDSSYQMTNVDKTSAPASTGTSAKTNIMNEKMTKEIMKKINKLKISFHNSEPVQTKGNHKSACFWDTCDFDTQIYFIPTSIINDTFQVYGCFCSPECAIAYLLKEHIDTSTKFERLHLIQLLYGGIYQYGKGLKPAPSPHFLLDKYYGNLTIQEYRQLFKGPQMIYVVNKPLTHILPELYEDNNDFLVNSKVIPTNNMKLKKRYKTMIIQNHE
jgi:hypothetical protein